MQWVLTDSFLGDISAPARDLATLSFDHTEVHVTPHAFCHLCRYPSLTPTIIRRGLAPVASRRVVMKFNIEYDTSFRLVAPLLLTSSSDLPVLFPYPRIYPGRH